MIFQVLYSGVCVIYCYAIILALRLWVFRFNEFNDPKGGIRRFRISRTERAFFIVVFGTFSSLAMMNAILPYIVEQGGNQVENEIQFILAHYAKAIFVTAVHYAALLDVKNFRRGDERALSN